VSILIAAAAKTSAKASREKQERNIQSKHRSSKPLRLDNIKT